VDTKSAEGKINYFNYAAQKKSGHDLHQAKRILFDEKREMRWREMKLAESWP
jgi:hypothetical protein